MLVIFFKILKYQEKKPSNTFFSFSFLILHILIFFRQRLLKIRVSNLAYYFYDIFLNDII